MIAPCREQLVGRPVESLIPFDLDYQIIRVLGVKSDAELFKYAVRNHVVAV